ncbi:MAG: polysaccharide biosynthesis tyrosine autokinase [Methylococcales bacterium]
MSDNSSINQTLNSYQTQDDDEIDLGEIIVTLFDNKWLIIAITTIALLVGTAKAILDTPIYQANAMLQVEESSQPLGTLDPLAELIESKVPVDAEIEIIKSRMVLGAAVKALNMEITAQPKFFPLIGKAIARYFQLGNKDKVAAPLFGYSDYAWGGELIKVDTLVLPTSWIGEELTLITGRNKLFKIVDNNNQFLAEGEVGKFINRPIAGEDVSFRLFVSLLKARPGTHFKISRQSHIETISSLQKKLSVSEKGKGTGILSFTMESASPVMAMEVLNKIANIYVQLNVEQKSAEAQNKLEFLDKQLPLIKDQLEAATAALNEYRLNKGSIDLNLETQSILGGVVENRTQITLLQQNREELRRSFTPSHPSVVTIDKQINRLRTQLNAQNKKIAELPETQQVILRLSRDVKVNTELYTTLLNNLQTLKVAKAGTVGNVRIIDYAVLPTKPVKPQKALIIALASVLGVMLGTALVFIRKMMSHGIEDPDIIEKHLNIPVYATVPHSDFQQKLNNQQKKNKSTANSPVILALEDIEDMAIESLRSLRTTLHFAFLEAKNNIIMITGPSPNVGKTFISINLAIVLANSGKKVLLIDADLRKGVLNKSLGVTRENGLSDLISEEITIPAEGIQTIEAGDIDFIPTGAIPPNPSELLLHERFGKLLEVLDRHYDHIIIDSPPVLAVTDACIIGRMVSATLMVVKAGEHPLRELQQCVKRLKQNDVDIKGIVFNQLPLSSSRYGYGKYVYQYNYQKN